MAPTLIFPAPVFTNQPFFDNLDPLSSCLSSPTFGVSSPGLSSPSTGPCSPSVGMERSIRRVMSKYGAGDLHGAALLPSYRCLRRRRPQEENQAVAVATDEHEYKIMLDVRDFTKGSLVVRAVGDSELVVEGDVSHKEESSPSPGTSSFSSSSRKFQQRFMFPGIELGGVKSTVSSDGVLTVTAPRKASKDKAMEYTMPVTHSSSPLAGLDPPVAALRMTQATSPSETALSNITAVSCGEHIVPIQLEGSPKTSTDSSQSSIQTSVPKTFTESQQQRDVTQALTKADDVQLILKDTATFQSNAPILPVSTGFGQDSFLSSMFKDSLVPIDTRGLFFQDSFFENSRRLFQEAVNSVLKRVSSGTTVPDPINWYTSHRATNLLEDTRAGTIQTEETNYKIVLDVSDFKDGSVNVRAVGDNELLVEGTLEKKSEGRSVSRNLRRRFVMPGLVECENITSALSSDGVLTITAPKKESEFRLFELKGEDAALTKKYLTNTSVFDSHTPLCASPSITIPVSTIASPADEIEGPFEPVYSRTTKDEGSTSRQSHTTSQPSVKKTTEYGSTQVTAEQSPQRTNVVGELRKTTDFQSGQSHSKNTAQTSNIKENEKIVSINYIDKSQMEIDHQNRLDEETRRQFQLIGNVKDLSDCNLKETAKQRKSLVSHSRDVPIRYENPSSFVFPIVRRGPFYQDSYFNEVHQNFQSAIRQVLDKWADVPSLLFDTTSSHSLCNFDRFNHTLSNYRSILDHDIFDDFTCYKSLRHKSLKEENQAATVRENTDDFKIVLDVHGFSEKDITIHATSHNELIVEGKVEERSSESQRVHKFRKQFILPGRVRMDLVFSALSADDVLTITVPKNKALSITD